MFRPCYNWISLSTLVIYVQPRSFLLFVRAKSYHLQRPQISTKRFSGPDRVTRRLKKKTYQTVDRFAFLKDGNDLRPLWRPRSDNNWSVDTKLWHWSRTVQVYSVYTRCSAIFFPQIPWKTCPVERIFIFEKCALLYCRHRHDFFILGFVYYYRYYCFIF